MKPLYLAPQDVDPKLLEHEKDILKAQLEQSGKTGKIVDQIIEGKLKKLYADICLLEQPFIKNDKMTIAQLLQEAIGKTGESIKISRFARFEVGTK